MTLPVDKSISNVKVVESIRQWTLNYTSLELNSNKCYVIEIVKDANDKLYLYSNYGRVGGTIIKEYRVCSDLHQAEMEAEKIVKSKIKKGYNNH